MIIICPCGEKKFEVNENLIPDKGKLLQCGSCNQTWFYNKNQQNTKFSNIQDSFSKNDEKDKFLKTPKKRNKMSYKTVTNIPDNKGSEIVKYQPKLRLNFSCCLFNNLCIFLSLKSETSSSTISRCFNDDLVPALGEYLKEYELAKPTCSIKSIV